MRPRSRPATADSPASVSAPGAMIPMARCMVGLPELLAIWRGCMLHRAVNSARQTLDAILTTARFWQRWAGTPLNERQMRAHSRIAPMYVTVHTAAIDCNGYSFAGI